MPEHSRAIRGAPLVALLVGSYVLAQSPARAERPTGDLSEWAHTWPVAKWQGSVLYGGQPDIEGFYSNTAGNHDNLTDPRGGIPGDPVNAGGGGAVGIDRGRQRPPRHLRPPSRISDPADGEMPLQPWARAKQKEFIDNFFEPTRPEYIEPLARCAPAGPSKSLYWFGFEIRQFKDRVLILSRTGTRIIDLTTQRHLHDDIKLWNGSSYGYWEGNALIVSVWNNNSKSRFARTGEFVTDHAYIREIFLFDPDANGFTYHATYYDDTSLTRPFTLTIPAKRLTEETDESRHFSDIAAATTPDGGSILEAYERTCVEGNENHGQLVGSGAAAGA